MEELRAIGGCKSRGEVREIYPLVISHSHGIDGPFMHGLPINSMVIFHRYVSHSQMVCFFQYFAQEVGQQNG